MNSPSLNTVHAFLQARPSEYREALASILDRLSAAMAAEGRSFRPHCDRAGKVYCVLATAGERPNLMVTTYQREPILSVKGDCGLPSTVGGRHVRWRERTGGKGIHGYSGFDRYLTHGDLAGWSAADFAELVRSAPPA